MTLLSPPWISIGFKSFIDLFYRKKNKCQYVFSIYFNLISHYHVFYSVKYLLNFLALKLQNITIMFIGNIIFVCL